MTRTGKCACGAIEFSVTAPFLGVGICHCTDCQKASGGGPNFVALAMNDAVQIHSGEARVHRSEADSGAMVGRAYCGDCGTPLWSIPEHEPFTPIKLGALDDTTDLVPQMHLYVSSAPAWHQMDDDLPKFDKMPPAQ